MKKKLLSLLLLSFIFGSKVFAQWAVFDGTAAANAIMQIYRMYDQINATIESVQNGYEQIKQAQQRVQAFTDFSKAAFSDWSDSGNVLGDAWANIGIARERTRQANGYVSAKVAEANSIKRQFENASVKFNGQEYTLKDLCGRGDDGQTIFGLAKDIGDYTIGCYREAAKGYEEGLTYEERQRIWGYYGVSPETYYLTKAAGQLAEGAMKGSLMYLADEDGDGSYRLKKEEEVIQEILALGDAADNGDSEVAHLQVLRHEEMKMYEQVSSFKHDFQRFMGMFASQATKEQIEREIEMENRRNKKADRDLQDLRMNTPYHHSGL